MVLPLSYLGHTVLPRGQQGAGRNKIEAVKIYNDIVMGTGTGKKCTKCWLVPGKIKKKTNKTKLDPYRILIHIAVMPLFHPKKHSFTNKDSEAAQPNLTVKNEQF